MTQWFKSWNLILAVVAKPRVTCSKAACVSANKTRQPENVKLEMHVQHIKWKMVFPFFPEYIRCG